MKVLAALILANRLRHVLLTGAVISLVHLLIGEALEDIRQGVVMALIGGGHSCQRRHPLACQHGVMDCRVCAGRARCWQPPYR